MQKGTMIPPPTVFGEEGFESSTITAKKIFQFMKSREFLVVCGGAFIVAAGVALTLLVSLTFFAYFVILSSVSMCFLIFSTFVFAQSSFMDGFFMTIGVGYFFVGLLQLIAGGVLLNLVPLRAGVMSGNVYQQLDLTEKFIEALCFFIGLGLCHKSFKGGWKILLAYISAGFLFCILIHCAIFWWQIFPTMNYRVGTVNRGTPFRKASGILWPIWFTVILALLTIKRKYFRHNVFSFLFLALVLRIVNTVLEAVYVDSSSAPLVAISLLTRFWSFTWFYLSVGTNLLRQPMQTLFYSLNLNQAALKNQNMVVSWMIDQVPSICVLLDDSLIVNHINKFGYQKLKCSPRFPLINQVLHEFLVFENEEKRRTVLEQMSNLINNRSGTDFIIFTSVATLAEKNRIIEWTLKLVQNGMSGYCSGSSSTRTSEDLEISSRTSRSSSKLDGNLSILCLGRDITDEIERGELLTEARTKAEKLASMQENFVANTSHELRTPLNCIVGVTDLLLLQANNETVTEMVTMIKTSANSLLALINDLLEFAKLKQGQTKLIYAPMRVRLFIEDIVMSMSVLYEKGGIDFCYWIARDCPDLFENDENRLRQILFNLLSNSVKFTQKGHIILRVKKINRLIMNQPTDCLHFSVADSGVGIPSEDVQNLFTRFFQVEKHQHKKIGTGIGLSISKQLVELMGGNIEVESQLGVGTTFSFFVPLELNDPNSLVVKVIPSNSEIDYTPNVSMPKYSDDSHLVLVMLNNKKISKMVKKAMIEEYMYNCERVSSVIDLNIKCDKIMRKWRKSGENLEREENEIELDTKVRTYHRMSILLEIKDLESLDLSKLKQLKSMGTYIQIVIALSHSASNQIETDSEELKDFQLNLVRKPFNIPKIALALRTDQAEKVETPKILSKPSPNINSQGSSPDLSPIVAHKPVFNFSVPPPLSHVPFTISPDSQEKETEKSSGFTIKKVESDGSVQETETTNIRELFILIVEDDKTNQKVLQLMIERIKGVKYEIANNGEEGLKMYEEKKKQGIKYDCIFMDSQMPVMDGSQATSEIRKMEAEDQTGFGKTFITALTANALMDESSNRFRTLVDDYLTKPIMFKTFSDKIALIRDPLPSEEKK